LIVILVLSWTGAPLTRGAPVHLADQAPSQITRVGSREVLVDFGRVAFGNLRLNPPMGATNQITVRFGEALAGGRVDRLPPGSVRYSQVTIRLAGAQSMVVAPPADKCNTQRGDAEHPPAVLTSPEWGVVTPFRWVEIAGWPGELRRTQIVRQAAFSATWDDNAGSFECSDRMLDRIWELCRYSIKATTFAGVYVDGDRERIPYEADAYLSQISQYAVEGDTQVARDTFDRLMAHPTWPTEWAYDMIFMAYADWMQTGDRAWLAAHYEALKSKLLADRANPDGLITSTPGQFKKDLVDWPAPERDGYVFTSVNTVVNAFYLRSLTLMAEMARSLHKDSEAATYLAQECSARSAFQEKLFNATRGIYLDGVGTDHASLHANLFPLAFGLVPADHRASVTDFCARRGMACSVYGAQYLLEGLFENDAGTTALTLMSAPNDRSWRHMVESGTTITWEAWDQKYKPNQDWNHAWGAAPANLLPRFVLGAQPLSPDWQRALIRPNPGNLKFAGGRIPTPHGPLKVKWKNDGKFRLSLTLPPGVKAKLELPAGENSQGVFNGSQPVPAHREGARWICEEDVSGKVNLEVRKHLR
jgi:alpha-L-rhamnosidase